MKAETGRTRPRAAAWLLALALAMAAGRAPGQDRAGAFDHYVLALSWTPSWCAAEGDARGAPECAIDDRRTGLTLHGLWPQRARDWPEFCPSGTRDPSRAETAAMADIMGSGGLAWHQWRKHGRCSGLSAAAYFAAARRAFAAVRLPPALARVPRDTVIEAGALERALIEANPGLDPAGVVVVCRGGLIREIRLCLTRDLAPRPCTESSPRDCRGRASLPGMR